MKRYIASACCIVSPAHLGAQLWEFCLELERWTNYLLRHITRVGGIAGSATPVALANFCVWELAGLAGLASCTATGVSSPSAACDDGLIFFLVILCRDLARRGADVEPEISGDVKPGRRSALFQEPPTNDPKLSRSSAAGMKDKVIIHLWYSRSHHILHVITSICGVLRKLALTCIGGRQCLAPRYSPRFIV